MNGRRRSLFASAALGDDVPGRRHPYGRVLLNTIVHVTSPLSRSGF